MLNKLNNRSTSRRATLVLVALALVLVAGTSFFASNAGAAGEHVETTYFSDASHTSIIGFRMKTCSGHLSRFGSVSRFHETYSQPCF